MATTPWYTSDKLIEAVKRKISVPINQNTFTEDDILAFANEEMYISQVPAVMQYHEEYFVYRVQVPLVTNISRYPVPDRSIGMKLRDLFWSDASGNYFEMTRISSGDKAFFQRNIGANQAIHKFYLENNDVLLTPSVVGDPSGKLNFFIFLRPNQLVRDSRARIFTGFTQDIVLSTNNINIGDKLIMTLNNQSNSPNSYEFIAVESSSYVISNCVGGDSSVVTLSTNHNIPSDTTFSIEVTGSTAIPDGVYEATSLSSNQLSIDIASSGGGVGTITIQSCFLKGATPAATVQNIKNLINSSSISDVSCFVDSSPATERTLLVKFKDITASFQYEAVGSSEITIEDLIGFDIDTSWENLLVVGDKIDFLQTKPGHRTYAYDVTIKQLKSRVDGSLVHYLKVNRFDLYTYYSNGYNFEPAIANIQIGDYVCLANECIIPQIPPDLHNVLAERTAARILAAIGDTEGLQATNAKLQEIEVRQGTLLDDRVEGAPKKITARHSLLRYGKMGTRKRM